MMCLYGTNATNTHKCHRTGKVWKLLCELQFFKKICINLVFNIISPPQTLTDKLTLGLFISHRKQCFH